jgi:acetylornithine deacetylase
MLDEHKLFRFLRELVDRDSTTGREGEVAAHVGAFLEAAGGFAVERWPVEPGRDNIFARRLPVSTPPRVVLSTHLDTVPPFFPSREDAQAIYGRGACDAKGIVAAMIFAALALAHAGLDGFGLLFVVGEERNSAGAFAANRRPQGARWLINGEPTESRLIRAGKGVLRLNLSARGRCAHSAYPELGESAILKLLDALDRLRHLALPADPILGPTTLNIGTIRGGRAPNVIPDEAEAEVMLRLVADAAPLKAHIAAALAPTGIEHDYVFEFPPIQLETAPGFPTGTVAFGTDIPNLSAWGRPILFGPGSIHVAHTAGEFIAKAELVAAVDAYARLVRYFMALEPGVGDQITGISPVN